MKLEHEVSFPVADDLAFYGLAGDIIRMTEPLTEAHPMALLVQILTAFGNMINQQAWFTVGEHRHHLKAWPVLVGETSRGRKGVSWSIVKRLLEYVDSVFVDERIMSGLSSGEGLIYAVRDPIWDERKDPPVLVDKGVEDKRLFIIEEEFASVLKLARREGSILSATLRQAWDTGDLRILNKNSPVAATGAHIAVIGHITKVELLRYIDETELANGFANRFLWISVRRTKLLASPPQLSDEIRDLLAARLREAAKFAHTAGQLVRSTESEKIWEKFYANIAKSEGAYLVDAVLSRAEAQIMRIACLYALLDKSHTIEADHLIAAWYLWKYAADSAKYIFGDRLGDPVADKILDALRSTRGAMNRTQIQEVLGRNQSHARIEAALDILLKAHLAKKETARVVVSGKRQELWMAVRT
jgi:hypothetical protein